MENNLNFNGSVDPPPGSETNLAVVTGAARRVGKTIALHLAQKGYAIGLHYHQSDEEAMATAQEIEKIGAK
jgi:NAD(P)-dependent dehydrogenase (short-subunit alcohol dehydrogenase family)